jgi:hypothetical protein
MVEVISQHGYKAFFMNPYPPFLNSRNAGQKLKKISGGSPLNEFTPCIYNDRLKFICFCLKPKYPKIFNSSKKK